MQSSTEVLLRSPDATAWAGPARGRQHDAVAVAIVMMLYQEVDRGLLLPVHAAKL
jgi:hypothetical protein